VLLFVVHSPSGSALSILALLIFLAFAAGARYAAIGAMGAGWWLCVLAGSVGFVWTIAGLRHRRQEKPDVGKSRWIFALAGTAMTVFAATQLVANQPRRTIGATTAEQGARTVAQAALRGEFGTAARQLDPTEFVSAREMFRDVGPKMRWIPNVRLNLTSPNQQSNDDPSTEIETTIVKTKPDGSVEVKVTNTSRTRSLKQRAIEAVARKVGVDTSPTFVMVPRKGRWFVSGQRTAGKTLSSIIQAFR
jgi:hypothetical protein